jgi:transcription termination factor NusB
MDLNIKTDEILSELKNITNRFLREVREDRIRTLSTFDESVVEINTQIQLNDQEITNAETDQLAVLRNQNTHLLDYLSNITEHRNKLMNGLNTYLNDWDIDEGDIYRERSSLVYSLYEIHAKRISEFNGSFPDIELEDMEQLIEEVLMEMDGLETESSEKEGSVMQDKGKGKAEDTSTKNDKGKGKAEDNSTNNDKGKDEDAESQFYEDTLKAMELSKKHPNSPDKDRDDSKYYEPESSKGRKSSKK